jgi:hypothetical protein
MRVRTLVFLVVIVVAVLQTGCHRASLPETADPAKARAALCQALDAWKAGGTADSLRSGGSITVFDQQWQNGFRLMQYEFGGDGAIRGCDWRCAVSLTVQDANGRRSNHTAIYTVSTAPALVVVRSEPES